MAAKCRDYNDFSIHPLKKDCKNKTRIFPKHSRKFPECIKEKRVPMCAKEKILIP